MENFILIIKSILLFIFVFIISMLGIAGQCILRHRPENFKKAIWLFGTVSFLVALYSTITYLCNKW